MAESSSMILQIALIFLAALVGGLIADALRQSAIIGYILGGLLVGPYVTGLVSDINLINSFSEIGIILLMFTLGMEFSLSRLLPVKTISILGGSLQITLVAVLGYGIGRMLGMDIIESVYLGCVVSISSTMVVLRLMGERGEVDTVYGRIMVGILIVQDLAVIIMVAVLSNIQQLESGNFALLIKPLLMAVFFVVLMLLVAQKVVPLVTNRAAKASNNDVFLLLAMSLGLGVALFSEHLGLSLSLGAFLAGVVISESDYVHEILGKVTALRDSFVIIFFVSVGMLINPGSLFAQLVPLAWLLVLILAGKFVVFFGIVKMFGYHSRVAFLVAIGMLQTGEFSFVLARIGMLNGAVSEALYNTILASSIISIMVAPLLISKGADWYDRLRQSRLLRWLIPSAEYEEALAETDFYDHVILCGYGRMGSRIGEGLKRLQIPFMVIDYEHSVAERVKDIAPAYIYGDAANEMVLAQARPQDADLIVIALPDVFSSRQVIYNVRKFNPDIIIVARGRDKRESQALYEAGANEVVQPEAEAGFEMIRHIMAHMKLPEELIKDYLAQVYSRDLQNISDRPGYIPKLNLLRARQWSIDAHSPFANKSLLESQLRQKTGCNIVSIKKEDGSIIFNPTADTVLLPGDDIVVLATDEQFSLLHCIAAGGVS